ncbi:MAG: hypothetical protein B0D91_07115 [Oceanospirillales bacterium LUC14_002_19_P2]|nr:MAG: hypothetical protein B0D91_07115 [Oceanospirillales bacterium LUC14_002_19_P2]
MPLSAACQRDTLIEKRSESFDWRQTKTYENRLDPEPAIRIMPHNLSEALWPDAFSELFCSRDNRQ